jgi:hypothetical protein
MNAPVNILPRANCGCGGCSCGGTCNGSCGSTCLTETMVRPRFFAGQLLTKDDLQQLEDYVVAKNRLHNRYLFGSGVVCGFEVLCDPCGGNWITVQPGYGLDCCGNDLLLACKTRLDVNAMIRDLLRDERGGVDCGDPCTRETQAAEIAQGKQPIREYCLTVQYCEQQTDPIAPYATDAPCSPQACEPSRVREGLRFALRCPEQAKLPPDLFSALGECFADVIKLEKAATEGQALRPGDIERRIKAGVEALRQRSFEELQRLLLDLIDRSRHPTACTLREQVLKVPPPPQTTQGTEEVRVDPGVDRLIGILLELLRECICMALLPACEPCDSLEVELACIRVQSCDVVEICNLSRQFVISPAALRYWFGFGRLEQELRRFCCPEQVCPPLPATEPRSRAERTEKAAQEQSKVGPLPELPAEGAVRAGAVLEDLLRGVAVLLPEDSPEALRIDHLGMLIGRLAGREPAKPDVEARLTELQRKVNELEAQLQQQGGRPRPTKSS